ncbi:hypothetical protein A6046_06895 [[Haemophilus] ducreyi]|uniref:Uncharacterized protein n=3 Tax=Pasteurellaceae TaxID=712 RepID=Q7VLB7_HAEDU|nr:MULTISPECIES: hypothetical protein [Pasteurellaceae]AAP96331.1 hypothetical protein HD_1546 [[Haemophilus] ducreyi 35000HP]AKO37035.1 hypothetical protein RZ61_06120 [[Haemophilus] ducreyi]AKO38497.1 hypothetical protein RZ62_06195 [[Haemophilus] ducreyi]AKO40037.1 hypothetical protein RZ63_06145 [[Haemophilus] ducreyi]AKO41510.1 hypothetical protein RZ64_06010 [[Haemophilus] ducreyi]
MKILIKLIAAFTLSIVISNISNYRPNATILNVLYTVSGILFSVGLGLIITLVPNGIRNPIYINEIRQTVNEVRNRFFVEFAIVTLSYVIFSDSDNWSIYTSLIYENFTIKVDLVLFSGSVIFLSLPYFVINFLSIQKLNNDIFDRVSQETQ